MLDVSRVAFVACGSLRNFSQCYKSWNIFKEQHNYVFTWETDYVKTNMELLDTSLPSIAKVGDLIDAKKQNHILDYNVFKESSHLESTEKSPFLWSILDNYISYDYDYILISRPDVWLRQMRRKGYDNYILPKDNEVHLMNVNHDDKLASDDLFFMKRTTYKKFSEVFTYFRKKKIGSIHRDLYDFFTEKNILFTGELKNYIDVIYYRSQTMINESNYRQVMEEHIRLKDNFESTKFQNNNKDDDIKLVAILLVSPTILSNKDKEIYSAFAMRQHTEKHGIDNYCWRIFEAATTELGLEKIEYYKTLYGIEMLRTDVIDCESLK